MESELVEWDRFIADAEEHPFHKYFWLIYSPLRMPAIVTAYWLFVTKIGPMLMESRKPMKIERIMMGYNAAQCIINACLVLRGISLLFDSDYNSTCSQLEDGKISKLQIKMFELEYFYHVVKLSDLFDTVFMVLKKNTRQITFLHIYHHMLMGISSYFTVRHFPGGQFTIFLIVNCGVHVVMYGYYLLTTIYPEYKKSAWWKKYLTQLQLFQFIVVTVHNSIALFNPNCGYSKGYLAFFCSQNFVMFYLFSTVILMSYNESLVILFINMDSLRFSFLCN